MATTRNEPMKLAPVRSFNDFLLDASKYLPPAFNDLKRYNNRVISNLLYFQTNYIALFAVTFSLFVTFGFNKMFLGAFGIVTTAAVVLFLLNKIPQLTSLRAKLAKYPHAVWIFGLVALDALIVYSTFRPILFFALALLVPVAVSIIHASVRSRSLKNKISNKMEQIGAAVYSNTPMEYILLTLGFDIKDIED